MTLLFFVPHARGGGVTVITHGFSPFGAQENVAWVDAMANAVAERAGGLDKVAIYSLKLTADTSHDPPWTYTLTHVSGPDAWSSANSNGEIVITFNWSSVAGLATASTTVIAQFLFNGLQTPGFNFCEHPIHLIGHSRGASLVSETARLLGTKGIWVDQVTTLDPHPECIDVTDAPVNNYENVLFADNYYQNNNYQDFGLCALCGAPVPCGNFVTGSTNKFLTNLTSGGYSGADPLHQDVHLWYHGTVDLRTPSSDGDGGTITSVERTSWWTSSENQGTNTGFHFSRIAGGTVYGGTRSAEGSKFGGANRSLVVFTTSGDDVWPNVQIRNFADDLTITQGDAFQVDVFFLDSNGTASIEIGLDGDANPYNAGSLPLTPVTTFSAGLYYRSYTFNSSTLSPGSRFLYAKISNSQHTRYYYARGRLQVISNGTGGSGAPSISSVSPSTLTTSSLPQPFKVYGSGFTSTSTLLFNGNIASDSARLSFISANEIDYNVIVQSAGIWTVRVVNGSQSSTDKSFTVNTPVSNTGSLVVNLSPSGAVSAGAQWQVDGTGYTSSGFAVGYLTPGSHTVSFKPISGYSTPASFPVNIVANQQTTANATYNVVAPTTYTLTLNAANGVITPSPLGTLNGNSFVYSAGNAVALYAGANPGYHFTGWSGDASGSVSPTVVTMNGNKNVTANFAPGDPNLGTVTLTIQPSAAVTAGVTWGFDANDFRPSDSMATGYTYPPNYYILILHPVDGWVGPSTVGAFLTGGQNTNITVTFTQDTTPGLLTVTLSPPDAVTAGAKWHVNGGAAQGNGSSVSLLPGTYNITFDSVAGWTAPSSRTVQVQRSQTAVVAGNYVPPIGVPLISNIFPAIGAMTGGTTLTIQGVNFTGPATVLIGGQFASNVVVSSSSQMTCSTPFSSVYGTAPVIVQTSSGNATNLNGFAYGMTRGTKIDQMGVAGGSVFAVAVQGNYAYIGEGRGFVVLDISNPASPSRIGRVAMTGIVAGIALSNQYAYVANGEGGLQVVDITIPTAPAIRGCYATTNWTWAAGIKILNGKAYVADEIAGLQIFDLGIPTVPVLLSTTNFGGSAEDVIVQTNGTGVVAYLTTGSSLLVIDASQASTPVVLGQTSMSNGSVTAISMSGNSVFGADWTGLIHMINVSNPSAPVDSTLNTGDNGSGGYQQVATANGFLYAESSVNGIGFTVFTVSGTTASRIGRAGSIFSTNPYYTEMLVSAGRAYVAGGGSGLQIVSVSSPASPSSLGLYTDGGACGNYGSVAVSGNTLCGTTGDFKVFDITTPNLPTLVGQVSGIGASRVVAGNGYAYSTANNNAIAVVRVTTPSSPQVLTYIPSSVVYGSRLALANNVLYAVGLNTSTQPRFVTMDVSSPASPVVLGTKDFSSFGSGIARAIAVNGTRAVVGLYPFAGQQAKLTVMDISNPSAPVEQGSITNLAGAYDVRMSTNGACAYVIDGNAPSLLYVVDVSNPTSPVVVTNLPMDNYASTALDIRGNELYATTGRGLYVYDVSNPTAPVQTRTYSMGMLYGGICAPNDSPSQSANVFIADKDGGVVALNEADIQPPSITITNPTSSSVYTNATSTLSMSGVAGDNISVARITWSNSQGGGGSAVGTTNWTVTGVQLLLGTNALTVTATDTAGNSSNFTLTVIYQTLNQGQTITFSPVADHTFGDAPITMVAAASSGLSVNFSLVSGPASLSSNLVTLLGAGTVTVQADQSGNGTYGPAPSVQVSFNVAKATQSIAFAPIPPLSVDTQPYALTATTSSGLPVYFSVASGPAILETNVVTLVGGGAVAINAWQPGNSNYNAAATVQQTFMADKIPQTITFGTLSQQTAGDAPFPLGASASSGLPVTFSILSGPAILSGNIVTLTGIGAVTVTASQPGNNVYQPASPVAQFFFAIAPANLIQTLTQPQLMPDGSFQLAFYPMLGSNYVVQASTNLFDWQVITNFTATDSIFYFADPSATNLPCRFYRVRIGP